MTTAAITKPCTACKAHFIGLASHTLCPDCEKDSEFYRLTRKKGDKRKFIPYPELFQQWKARRKECSEWRSKTGYAFADWQRGQKAEQEKSLLLMVLYRLTADPEPLLAMADELTKAREEVTRAKALAEFWQGECESFKELAKPDPGVYALLRELEARKAQPTVPQEMRRRLVQLCHPDRHEGSEASRIATQWLLQEVKP